MLTTKLNAHGGFTPASVAPPNEITPELVLRHHHSQRRGGMGGQARSPPSSYQCFVFHSIVNGIPRSPKINVSLVCPGVGRNVPGAGNRVTMVNTKIDTKKHNTAEKG
jgi:hypothetical protein